LSTSAAGGARLPSRLQIARALSPLLAAIVLVGASSVPTGLGVLAGLSGVLLAWRKLKQ